MDVNREETENTLWTGKGTEIAILQEGFYFI